VPGAYSHVALLRVITELPRVEPDLVIYMGAWNDFSNFHYSGSLSDVPYVPMGVNYYIDHAGWLDEVLSENLQTYNVLRTKLLEQFKPIPARAMDCNAGLPTPSVPLDAPTPESLLQYALAVGSIQSAIEAIRALPVLVVEPNLYFGGNSGGARKFPPDYSECLSRKGVSVSLEESRKLVLRLKGKNRHVMDPSVEFAGRMDLMADHLHLTGKGGTLFAKRMDDFLVPLIAKLIAHERP